MTIQKILLGLVITAGIIFLVQPLQAQIVGEQNVIYQTAFTSNPSWQTNNPSTDYWDPGRGMYHYGIEASTGGYAYVPIDYDRGPFTLEYDWMPVKTDETATFRFGVGSKEMDRSRGTVVLSEFTNGKNGKLMYLRVVTPGNKLVAVASGQGEEMTPSYGGPIVRFEDNKTYHVVLNYDDEHKIVTMRVGGKSTGREIWSYYVNTWDSLHGMNRIFLASIGDYGMMGRTAEGYIDNVRLYTPATVTSTPTEITTVPTTVPATFTTRPTSKPTTAVPIPTPMPTSPPSPLIPLVALGIAGAVLLGSRFRPKQ